MSTLFISDIHLSTQHSATTAGFLRFLRTQTIGVRALYILGDLFEVWIGDDDPNPLHREIAVALEAISQRGTACYFIHGNRDFLLGRRYAKTCGMVLLPSQQVIQLDKLRIVMLHGDLLCTDDTDYQLFRRSIHQRWIQKLFLSLPIRYRLDIANAIRNNSMQFKFKRKHVANIDEQEVMTLLHHTKSSIMIHGHTHEPAIHVLSKNLHRAVLGSWHHQGSVIRIIDNNVTLHKFPLVVRN